MSIAYNTNNIRATKHQEMINLTTEDGIVSAYFSCSKIKKKSVQKTNAHIADRNSNVVRNCTPTRRGSEIENIFKGAQARGQYQVFHTF